MTTIWDNILTARADLTALTSSVQTNLAEVKDREAQVVSLYNQLLGQTGEGSILSSVPLSLGLEKGTPSAVNNNPIQYQPFITIPASAQIAGLGETLDDLCRKCRIQKYEFAWTSTGTSGTPNLDGLNCKFTMTKAGAVFKIVLSNAANILPVAGGTLEKNDEVKLQSARLLMQWLTDVMAVKTIDPDTNTSQLLAGLTAQKTGIDKNIALITEIALTFNE
jgi:hypothetical protein